jgi:hypothetical protein
VNAKCTVWFLVRCSRRWAGAVAGLLGSRVDGTGAVRLTAHPTQASKRAQAKRVPSAPSVMWKRVPGVRCQEQDAEPEARGAERRRERPRGREAPGPSASLEGGGARRRSGGEAWSAAAALKRRRVCNIMVNAHVRSQRGVALLYAQDGILCTSRLPHIHVYVCVHVPPSAQARSGPHHRSPSV